MVLLDYDLTAYSCLKVVLQSLVAGSVTLLSRYFLVKSQQKSHLHVHLNDLLHNYMNTSPVV